MGKFGKRPLPKFMDKDEAMEEGVERIQEELQEGHSAPEIVSLGDADGGDFITITIKTVEGEEVPLEFKLEDEKEETDEEGVYKGTLTAEHNDVVYTIHCEIEDDGNGDYDIKIGDLSSEGEPKETEDAPEEDDNEEVSEAKVLRFNQFMNENEGAHSYEPTSEGMSCSENAKMAIKSLCENHLCNEGMDYENNENAEHTYEGYVNECMDYLRECMMENWQK